MINQLLVKCELVTTEEYRKTFTSITVDSYLLKRESENKESVFDCSVYRHASCDDGSQEDIDSHYRLTSKKGWEQLDQHTKGK